MIAGRKEVSKFIDWAADIKFADFSVWRLRMRGSPSDGDGQGGIDMVRLHKLLLARQLNCQTNEKCKPNRNANHESAVPLLIAAIAACFIILAGCQPQQPFYFHEDPELSHYKGMATEIEYPDVDACTLGDVKGAIRPFSLQNNQPKEVWDLKLEDAIRYALTNNKIMRTIGGQVQGPPDFISRDRNGPLDL